MHKAIQLGEIRREKSDAILRKVFWNGLVPELKDISGHKYDTIDDFDELRLSIKKMETSKKIESAQPQVHSLQSKEAASEIQQLKGMIQQLTNRLDRFETDRKTTPTPPATQRMNWDHLRLPPPSQVAAMPTPRFPHSASGAGHVNFRSNAQAGAYTNPDPHATGGSMTSYHSRQPQNYDSGFRYSDSNRGSAYQFGPVPSRNDSPVCYRCGQVGHLQIGCRVILDHYRGNDRMGRGHLNQYRPMRRGHP